MPLKTMKDMPRGGFSIVSSSVGTLGHQGLGGRSVGVSEAGGYGDMSPTGGGIPTITSSSGVEDASPLEARHAEPLTVLFWVGYCT